MFTLFCILLCVRLQFTTSLSPKKYPYEKFMQEVFDNEDETARIIGGTQALAGQFPYAVALFHDKKFICTASIIDEETVLTAAHCVVVEGKSKGKSEDAKRFQGAIGHTNLKMAKRVQFTDLFVHPKYDTRTFYNDIAIFKMDPVEFSNTTNKICIARNDTAQGEYTTATVMGWGRTQRKRVSTPDDLYHVEVGVTKHEDCKKAFKGVDGGVTDDMICESGGGKGACNGDSGGPMAFVVGKQGISHGDIQLGIGSFVKRIGFYPDCASTIGNPSVYTRVSSYTEWILSHSGNSTCML